MRVIALAAASLLALSTAALAQIGVGPTQSRDGMGDASTPTMSGNGGPAGSMNATTGPQAHPAYPSGSDTPNPGAGLVRATTPKPATGPAAKPPGTLKTVTIHKNGSSTGHPAIGGCGRGGEAPAVAADR